MDDSGSTIDPYEAHAGRFHFTPDDVVRLTKLPSDGKVPHIIGWSGPARSGTTGMLLLLAGHPQVDRVYFQPQKTILRKGGPEFELYGEDRLICMKEVYGIREGEDYDPIEMLLQAGVSPEDVTWITFLRDPLFSLASWRRVHPTDPQIFIDAQKFTIEHFYKYRNMGVKMIPFVYDLLKDNEDRAVRSLLKAIGLESEGFDLEFDMSQIEKKLVKGQSAEKEYYDYNIKNTFQKKKFVYSNNNYGLPAEMIETLEREARPAFNEFMALAKSELQL
jgi:hypothetical protein